MALHQWALPQLSELLPLDEAELKQILTYSDTLSNSQAAENFSELLGDSPEAVRFITAYNERRTALNNGMATTTTNGAEEHYEPPPGPPPSHTANADEVYQPPPGPPPSKSANAEEVYEPPPGPPPSHQNQNGASPGRDIKSPSGISNKGPAPPSDAPPSYARPTMPPPAPGASRAASRNHTNKVIEVAKVRARDEQQMQQLLQNLQYQYNIYNDDIEPEHETEYYCNCPIHQYKQRKWNRVGVQDMWSQAVMYPGEKAYTENFNRVGSGVWSRNPYRYSVVSPYGYGQMTWGPMRPRPNYHAQSIHQTIALNNQLNREAQSSIDQQEPKHSIWEEDSLEAAMAGLGIGDQKKPAGAPTDTKARGEKAALENRQSSVPNVADGAGEKTKTSKLSAFRKSIGIKSSEERAVGKASKALDQGKGLREAILGEEAGRWPDDQWRWIVEGYQDKVGMTKMITDLRAKKPTQYLHLLRAGYFEPIPVAWANQASNPLKFTIESASGWRGITPAWRGYEDTAEERLYWVLNHRVGSVGMRMKPDFISEMNMARDRMAKAVEPPPAYFSPNDICHVQHTSTGYSKQVMPAPFHAYDRPEQATDDTMILLDVSGSMDFDPVRPVYNQYLITGYARSTQPKNKDVAKAIIRRFTDAMANHDHQFRGYDFTTFSSQAKYIGTINHRNLDQMWRNVRIGGGTRVMTGWQKVKELHFQKHSESATHHPVYGWQAGLETPILRLLLLLDGEATDMDEFELDLLGLSWAHVTIFLIGVDGCPHHHRHANELQRISDVNHHVSFVDAQGNTPERFVTHELLKRHLGYDVSMQEFEQLEELPPYTE